MTEKKGYFNYWEDWSKKHDLYAMTRSNVKGDELGSVRHSTQLLPVDGERLQKWISRCARDSMELTERSRYHHIHGTSKTWACHSSMRSCFICEVCDYVDILRSMAVSLLLIDGMPPLCWLLSVDDSGVTHYSVVLDQSARLD